MRATTSLSVVLVVLALGASPAWGQEGLEELGGPFETAVHAAGFEGGEGDGASASANARTRTFSSAAYVDYNSRGGEPSDAVDRYPFHGADCPAGQATCFKDLVYVSAPQGLPGFSFIWKSDDLGGTFRLPSHLPATGNAAFVGPGGGDSEQAVGELTHNVFFIDLPGDCVTASRSTDLGETWTTDPLGCGGTPGAIDDRQWIDTDEGYPGSQNVYISFIDTTSSSGRTLALARSQHDGLPGTYTTDSVCNTLTAGSPTGPAQPDDVATPCPDPRDARLRVAGPVVADKAGDHSGSHILYIPFIRRTSAADSTDTQLYVARSQNGGTSWTRHHVADLGAHNPRNIFPQLAIDRGGNLYFTWAQTMDGASGETDVFYGFSTDHGVTWSAPIDLTQEKGDSAVFPWMVAGDAGRVDLVFYKANTGLNPNLAFVDAQGRACNEGDPGCRANPSVWNVYFSQSLNALNRGRDFKTVQISDRPNHIGQICTLGTGCSGDRDLLDFFTIDVDHLGAANITWADDNSNLGFVTRNLFARQLSSTGVYKNVEIGLQRSWPTRDHSATDRAGDVRDATGAVNDSCPGMDVLGTSAKRSGSTLTVSLTLNAAPTAPGAIACSRGGATGGLWGAEFWAASAPDPDDPGQGNDNFYVALASDVTGLDPQAGRVNDFTIDAQSWEFNRKQDATAGGTCITTPAAAPCTLTLTTSLATLGIKPGAGLFSMTGLSTYLFGTTRQPPGLRITLGNTELGDAVTPFALGGTGEKE